MNDDRLDDRLREAAEAYHRPPPATSVPRDAMWAEIMAARTAPAAPGIRVRHAPPWWMLAAAAVVLIAAGIAIGRRMPGRVGARETVAQLRSPVAADSAASARYRVATAEHLSRVEALLVAFRTDAARGHTDEQMSAWARDLLTNTRLLLDSPAARDPVRRELLMDLELVLAQIVQLAPGAPAQQRDLIDGALTDEQMLTRLRAAVPAARRGT